MITDLLVVSCYRNIQISSNFHIFSFTSNKFLFSSDVVQLLDDKTIYIPNFFLTVGLNKGYKFKVRGSKEVRG